MPSPRLARRRFRTIVIVVLVLLATAATLLARPPIALAGTFTVYSCRTPSGTWTGMEGWASSASAAVQNEDFGVATSCTSQSMQLRMWFGLNQLPVGPGSWVRWTFEAPQHTQIGSLSLHRTLQLGWPVVSRTYGRPYVYDAWHDADTLENQLEFYVPPWNDDTAGIDFPPSLIHERVSWDAVSVRLRCWELMGEYDCGPFQAYVTIPRAVIGLTDVAAPAGFATGGELAGAGPVRGVGSLAFHATDEGGGVYRVALAVDGVEVAREVVDDDGGSCADVEPANADAYEFGAPQPCPLAVDGSIKLDTATLADGSHAVEVTVEDAAGNAHVVFDGSVQTHNAPISTGLPTLSGQTSVGAQLTAAPGQWDGAPTGYDHRWLRCGADGAGCTPIAGASGPVYVLTEADAYHRMRVELTAENGSGSTVARSGPSALVADGSGRTAPPSGAGAGGSASTSPPSSGGIDGLANPLAQVPGHVGNGAGASARARIAVAFQRPDGGTARRVRSRHGRRWTIAGRLTDASGAGIAGAQVGAAWKVDGRGWVARPGVRTRADGRFVYLLPPGPSRAVRFTYFAFSDSRAVELSNVVRVDVLAPLEIRADRRRVTGSRVVRLSGRVGGGPIPRGGVLVTLQGFQAGWGWRTFRTVRTDRRGRWSTQYRFRLSSGRFGFRAVVPRQGSFPYATTRSKGVFVVVS
jgi:hypothetical protein